MGPAPLGGSCERGKVPSPWELPSPAGRSAGTERELQRLRGECSNQLTAGRRERDQHTWSWPPCCTPQPKTCNSWYEWGLGAEAWASVDRPGERTGSGSAENLEGLECGLGCNWVCVQDEAWVRQRSPTVNTPLKGGVGPCQSSLTLTVLKVGRAPPLRVLGARQCLQVPTHRAGAEI